MIMKLPAIVLLATLVGLDVSGSAFAQGSASQGAHSVAGPVVGYVAGKTGASLTPVVGIPGACGLGANLPVTGSAVLYVAPGAKYVLASEPGAPTSIASLSPGALQFGLQQEAIPASLFAPDLIALSPKGSAAVLYSKSGGTVQVLSGLPNSPHVEHSFPVVSGLLQIAVSDDWEAVFAQEENGSVIALDSGMVLYKAQLNAAISFVPGSHTAVLADASNNRIVQLNQSDQATALSGSFVSPNALVVTSDGSTILVASSARKSIYAVNRNSGQSQEYPVAAYVKSFQAASAIDTFLLIYSDGSYGLVSWRNNRLSTYFVGVLRGGVN
jgi:DNA-binding beta-propeller fold protein YncE